MSTEREERWEHRFGWLRIIDRISISLAIVAGVGCLGMMLNIVADVIARAASRPLSGTVDLTQFAWMPVIVSLGLGYALLLGQHIRVTLLSGSASLGAQRIVEIVGLTVTLVTAAALAWYSMERALMATGIAEMPPSTPWLPIWAFRWVLVLGAVGFAMQAAAQLIRAITIPVFDPERDEWETPVAPSSPLDDSSAETATPDRVGAAR